MGTLHALPLITVLAMNTSAQVVFDLPTAIPPFGMQQRDLWHPDDDTTVVTTGQSIVWDFTGLLFGTPLQYIVAPPATTPLAGDFPSSTHAVGEIYPGGDTTWSYTTLAGDSLSFDGGSWPPPPGLLSCSDPVLWAVFPFSYSQVIEDSSACMITGSAPYNTLDGRELVATGTIQYPGGTIADVGLVRRHWNGAPLDEYKWFSTSDILVSVGSFAYGSLTLFAPASGSGIDERNGAGLLRSYPSPATDEVFVDLPAGSGARIHYHLLDAAGLIVGRGDEEVIGGRMRLDVSGLAAGHYLLRSTSSQLTGYARVTVAR